MFGISKETWEAIGKYGVPSVLCLLGLGIFREVHLMQLQQIQTMQTSHEESQQALIQAHSDVAAGEAKVADAVDDIRDSLTVTMGGLEKELDDVGDQLRRENDTRESLHESVKRLLQNVWNDYGRDNE